jgi:hypothetical protein
MRFHTVWECNGYHQQFFRFQSIHMGLFDFFRKGSNGPVDQEKLLARHTEKVMDKRSMSPDRFASIDFLCKHGTEEAWRALLPRYNFTVDPSITDREEKQYIFDHIVEAGETAVGPVKEYLRKTSAVNWPIKMLRELLSTEDFVSELLDVLKNEDTVYQKNPDRKILSIIALESAKDDRVVSAVQTFLDDASEDTRFHAVRTLLAQESPASALPLAALFVRDDSMRVRTTVVDGLVTRQWAVPSEHRDKVGSLLSRLPNGPFLINAEGLITKSR